MRDALRFRVTEKRERAQTTAEFVVVLPLIILLLFLMIDFGWLLKNWIVVTNTAREAARCVSVSDAKCDDLAGFVTERLKDGVLGKASAEAATLTPAPLFFDEDGDGFDDRPGDSVKICIKAPNKYITPAPGMLDWLLGGSLPSNITGCEHMRLEIPRTD